MGGNDRLRESIDTDDLKRKGRISSGSHHPPDLFIKVRPQVG